MGKKLNSALDSLLTKFGSDDVQRSEALGGDIGVSLTRTYMAMGGGRGVLSKKQAAWRIGEGLCAGGT